MAWIAFSTSSDDAAQSSDGTVFGDKALKDVVRVKWGHSVEPQSNSPGVLRRRKPPMHSLPTHVHGGKATWGHSKKAPSASWGETSQKPNLLAPPASWMWENPFLTLKPPSVRCFAMAAGALVQMAISLLWRSSAPSVLSPKHWFLTHSF